MKSIYVKHVVKCIEICQAYFAIAKLPNIAFPLTKNPKHFQMDFLGVIFFLRLVVRLDHQKEFYHERDISWLLPGQREEDGTFKCSNCEFKTNRSDALLRHERLKHNKFNKQFAAIKKKYS